MLPMKGSLAFGGSSTSWATARQAPGSVKRAIANAAVHAVTSDDPRERFRHRVAPNHDGKDFNSMAFPAWTRNCCRLTAKIAVVASLVMLSSYCTKRDNQAENAPLTSDESYLVDTYARIEAARELFGVTPSVAESLFAGLDSTIDRNRVSNTIRALNADPDRWLAVYRGIEKALEVQSGKRSREEAPSEQNR